jgi:hypothetical protein
LRPAPAGVIAALVDDERGQARGDGGLDLRSNGTSTSTSFAGPARRALPRSSNAHQCDFAGFSESTTSKPERVTVANAPAGTYTILVINWGPDQESFSYQAALTTGGTAASAATQGRPEKFGVQQFLMGR